MRITFRKYKPETGLASIGRTKQSSSIKIDGMECGTIHAPTWVTKDGKWSVMIAVVKKDINEDGNPNCKWRWFRPKNRFGTDDEAKEFVKKLLIPYLIKNEFDIYYFD